MITKISVEELKAWDRQHSWHFLTDMGSYGEWPCVIERGEGSWLWDIEGNRYLDGNASMWTSTFGHRDVDLDRVMRDQIDRLTHTTKVGRGHLPGVLLARQLAELTNMELTRSYITNNGSTAIETALKMSFGYWKRVGRDEKKEVVSMEGGHHGLSFGALSVSDSRGMKEEFTQWCFESRKFPYPSGDGEESLGGLESLLAEYGSRVACLVMESGVQAVAGRGIVLQPEGFLKSVKDLCEIYEVHLILDEVFTGCGRLGEMFWCKEEGVYPDFLCLGKGISAGYLPMGVTMTREEIFKEFMGRPLLHGHTYGGNPLACRVALENLRKIEEMIRSGKMKERVEIFGRHFLNIFEGNKNVSNIRKRGMVGAIDLEEGVGMEVCRRAREYGLWVRPYKDSIFFVPALNMGEEDIEFMFKTVDRSIKEFYENK